MIERIVTLLYLSGEPLPLSSISETLGVSRNEIEETIPSIEAKLSEIGLHILRNDDALSIVTDTKQAPLVEHFWKEELKGDLTPAALQVLTIIAYMGPVTRHTVSFIRGVQSSQSIRTLTVRGLIRREGEMCFLTSETLRQLGVTHLEELPQYEHIHAEFIEKIKSLEG